MRLGILFERALAQHAERVAVEVPPGQGRRERGHLTYAELDEASRAVATRLAEIVRGECIVAVLLPRTSQHLFAVELGVLRAGAAFTCLDPAFPDGHIAAILADARPVALVTDPAGRARLARNGFAGTVILDAEELVAQASSPPAGHAPGWLTPSSLAYVIYTSGTTGRPKGVMIEHASIANLVASDLERFGLGPDDRVAQGSSASYDSSVEETWLAWAAGAALVVLDDDTARSGPDLVSWLRAERISVLCPTPTLLRTTGCARPHAELPALRLVYAGGEALPQDVADRWSDGIRFENGYGPTECTVTVLRAPVHRGEPVTIGVPVRGNRAHVLDDELREVPEGQVGELCISGLSLARGYLGRPELTAERFPLHGRLGRIYRTGDLVRRDARGDYLYLGRIDAQVKLRGYRIELGAVEALLAAQPGVRAAACRIQGAGAAQVLVAHVVPSDPAQPPNAAALLAAARAGLPAYMVPARIGMLGELPTLASGKLDRQALPEIAAEAPSGARIAPRNALETSVAAAFRKVLRAAEVPSVEADFFLDLGGDSLGAAEVVSLLRADPSTAAVTVRDLYEARTAAGLAARAQRAGVSPSRPVPARARRSAALATACQVAWLLASLVAGSALVYLLGFEFLFGLVRGLDAVSLALFAPLLSVLAAAGYTLVTLAATVAAKWILVGRYRPGRVPVWSGLHVRMWIVQQFASSVPWGLLQDTVFLGAALRALGARIGRRVHVHRGVDLARGGWDLLEIGDDATIAQDAALRLVQVEDVALVLGPVKLGARSLVDVRAGIGPEGELGADAILGPLAWLSPGGRVPDGEAWEGVPARRAATAPVATPATDSGGLHPVAHGALVLASKLARIGFLVGLPFLVLAAVDRAFPGLDARAALAFLDDGATPLDGLAFVLAFAVLAAPLSALAGALWCRVLGQVRPGTISRWSFGYLRVLAKTDALRSAGELLSGTLFWPFWLRSAGMRVGRRAEISTILDVVPELVEIDDECFLADGIYLGGPRVRAGVVTLAPTRLAGGTFLGNHCVVPAGTALPAGVLVGVSTVADGERTRTGTAWFGLPALELPRRPLEGVDRRLTHEPGPLRFTTRLVWESARLLLPVAPALVALAWLELVMALEPRTPAVQFHLAVLPAATLGAAAVLCGAVLALKWTLLGRVRPGQHGLWSCWCSRWDFLYMAWGQWARPLLARLEGTQLLAWYLRAMGARVGRRVLLDAGFAHVVDPDMLRFEDDATVGCLFQAHSFEDRVLKIDHVTIGRGAWVGPGTVLFYGADVGAGARVLPHGVVMKHERLPPGATYVGSPVGPVAR